MTTYNEVDNLTKNNKGIAVLGSRVESRNGMHAGHAMAVVGNAKLDNGQEVIIIWNPWDNGFMTQDAKKQCYSSIQWRPLSMVFIYLWLLKFVF